MMRLLLILSLLILSAACSPALPFEPDARDDVSEVACVHTVQHDVSYSAFRSVGGGVPFIDADGVLELPASGLGGTGVEVEIPLPRYAAVVSLRAWARSAVSNAQLILTLLQRHDDVQPSIGVIVKTLATAWEWVSVVPLEAPHVRASDQDVWVVEIANRGESTAMISKLEVHYDIAVPCPPPSSSS